MSGERQGNGVSAELVRFIRDHVTSVEQLEILLLLRRDPSREWSAAQVSEEIRTGLSSAQERLRDLLAQGMLVSSGAECYRYAPRAPDDDQLIAQLAGFYEQQRHTVINLIFSRPLERIRVFARAFRLRKDEEHDG